ncbi:MAG: alpha/beta hydrolase [Pseudomonadota bacterium]
MAITLVICLTVLVAAVQILAAVRERAGRAAFPPSGQFVQVDGIDIHMHVSGKGPDVVLIHGASGSLRDFTFDLANRLNDRYRVIAVDRPGHGWSDRADGYGGALNLKAEPPALQARLLRRAVAQLGVTKPVVVGHSYGGAVALAWAVDSPDKTAALVLLGAASMPWPGSLDPIYRINASLPGSLLAVPLISALVPSSYIDRSVNGIFAPQEMPAGYLAHFGPLRSLTRSSLRANAQQVNSLRPHIVDMAAEYPGLTLPVEALHGTADTTVPMDIHSEPLVEVLPDATLTRLEGVGHMPQHAMPEEVEAAIDRAASRAGLR